MKRYQVSPREKRIVDLYSINNLDMNLENQLGNGLELCLEREGVSTVEVFLFSGEQLIRKASRSFKQDQLKTPEPLALKCVIEGEEIKSDRTALKEYEGDLNREISDVFIFPLKLKAWELPVGCISFLTTDQKGDESSFLKSLRTLTCYVENIFRLKVEQNVNQNLLKEYEVQLERQDHILEGAGLGAWDWWLTDNRVHFDRRWCEMLGLDVNQIKMDLSTWNQRVHPDDRDGAYADIKSYLEGKTDVYENLHRLRHENGEWVWILDRGRISERFPDGKPKRFTGTHLDITHYKKQTWIANQIQELAKIGGWELDAKTGETIRTPEVYRIYGLPDGMPTNKIQGLSYYAEHEREKLQKSIGDSISLGKDFTDQFEFYDHHGLKKWVEVTIRPQKNASGQVTKLIGTIQDVTEQVLSHESLIQTQKQAAQSARLATIGEVAAGVAHEINNPLAIMAAHLSVLDRSIRNPSEFEDRISKIQKAIQRVSKIVSGLKKFSRTSARTPYSIHSIQEVLSEALDLSAIRLKTENIKLNLNLTEDFQVKVDPLELEQVLVNLIHNSVDAIKGQDSPWIEVRLFKDLTKDGSLVIQVIDSGAVPSEDVREKLFQPFYTTKKVGEGTGLGLSISKGIIEQHGGQINLNLASKTTCFEIHLPIYEAGAVAS